MVKLWRKQEVVAALKNKLSINFRITKEMNGWFVYNDKKILRVTVPKGRGSLRKRTQASIINQLKLTNESFANLIDCPLKHGDYLRILKGKHLLPKS